MLLEENIGKCYHLLHDYVKQVCNYHFKLQDHVIFLAVEPHPGWKDFFSRFLGSKFNFIASAAEQKLF